MEAMTPKQLTECLDDIGHLLTDIQEGGLLGNQSEAFKEAFANTSRYFSDMYLSQSNH